MKSLLELYQNHTGKVSDKWTLYLAEYDRLFSAYRGRPISLLEIGVQNGGSLEIWSRYLEHAQCLVGCDINPDCGNLQFEDPRIHVVALDANTDAAERQIRTLCPTFDLIIDDGSHTSSDIIRSFARYFPLLNEGGLFVAEDLHCSYWQEFEGGLFDPLSSMSFFKRLADLLNHEHWGVERVRRDAVAQFCEHFEVELSEALLAQIRSIEFINSMCVIRKDSAECNVLGPRVIAGQQELVVDGHLEYQGTLIQPNPQHDNPWSSMPRPREFQVDDLQSALDGLRTEADVSERRIQELEKQLLDAEGRLFDASSRVDSLEAKLLQREQQARELEATVGALLSSTSWKVTASLRFAKTGYGRARRLVALMPSLLARGGGLESTARKGWRVLRAEGLGGVRRVLRHVELTSPQADEAVDSSFLQPLSRPAPELLAVRVLLVAELSIPQCEKYRVTQKREMLEHLGVDCTVVSWNDAVASRSLLSSHSIVIFYRVPAFPPVLETIAEAQRLKLDIYWEVDDLIFDRGLLEQSKTLAALDKPTYAGLLEGAVLYRNAMLACGMGIASTSGLAEEMRKARLSSVSVIENALDAETLRVAEGCARNVPASDGYIRIVYGSGTVTHNVDFEEAAQALLDVLKANDRLRFRLIGRLDLPEMFDVVASQIETIPFCSYEEYLGHLGEADISIAPLEDFVFNDAKSNIKYLEASVLGRPSVCSPRAAFRDVIRHGENGFLASSRSEWRAAFQALIDDPALRTRVGEAARATVMEHYTPQRIAEQQVMSVIQPRLEAVKTRQRVLAVNVYYAPKSFGGATVVAEEINKLLMEHHQKEVFVFTVLSAGVAEPYALRRFEAAGVQVFGCVIPPTANPKDGFDDPMVRSAFDEVLRAVQPDVVHLHSIQGIGVTAADLCIERDIPYVITLHDAWWICGRQFMINDKRRYCNQWQIDLSICARCVDHPELNQFRQRRLQRSMSSASRLLAPSRFFAELYKANGCDPDRVVLNGNGVLRPRGETSRFRRGPDVVFGYVGGNTEIKGVHLVRKAFERVEQRRARLVVVDNTLNLGFSSFDRSYFRDVSNMQIVPAYNESTIDDFFAGIDVLLFPTQWKESFGLTVREAIVRNVWVITTDAGGVVEDLIPGENGTVIPFDDQGEALYKAILEVYERYAAMPDGSPVDLPKEHIRFFDEQAAELSEIYDAVTSEPAPLKLVESS